ncbi:hypothetical protein J2Y54_000525 [Sphingomonas sp. BE123]|uniref:hypothetical protein n=1 Tax=Sphingomonas sp. BE123 TaxID=2817842 RepID=UPI002863D3FF|nr:hypothetical protein [Sphingomonas sp. BE123]MDR6851032.1 hypothetical protein [Sphingomonas sp. BE123]
MTPDQVVAILRRARFRIGTEAALQASIAEALDNAGAALSAQVRLASGESTDFMVNPRRGE